MLLKIYYSHAMVIYGTKLEEKEKLMIRKNFQEALIVDPGSFQDNSEKQKIGMTYCLKLVEKCDILIFSKFMDKITAGVGLEINHAILKGIPVYELIKNTLKQVKKEVLYISRLETILLYKKWQIRKTNF